MSRQSVVTDHALLRWLERVRGVDVDAWRHELAAHVAPYARSGCALWRAPEASYYFSGRRLVTVLRANGRTVPRWPSELEF